MTSTNWIVVIVGTWVAGAALTAWQLMDGTGLGERPADGADALLIGLGPVTQAFWLAWFVAIRLGIVAPPAEPR